MKSNNIKNKVSSKKRTGFIKIFTLLCFSFLSLTLIFSGFNFKNNIQYSFADSSTELTQEIQDYIINNGYYKSRNLLPNSTYYTSSFYGVETTIDGNRFSFNGSATNSTNVYDAPYIYLDKSLPIGDYTISLTYVDGSVVGSNQYRIGVRFLYEDETFHNYEIYNVQQGNLSRTVNVVKPIVAFKIIGTFYVNEYYDITYDVMVEAGSIATPYRPYEETVEEYKQNNAINLSWSYQDDYLNRFQVSDSYPSVSIPLPNNYLSINNITFVLRGFYSSGQILYDKSYNYSLSFDDLPILLLGYQDYEYCRLSIVDNSLLFEDLGSSPYFSYIENLVIGYSTLGYSQEEFDENYSNGYELGNNEGYSTGYDEGYSTGKSSGYELGKTDALNGKTTFRDLVYSIIDAPFNVVSSAFNFDIFGINVASFLMLIVSLLLVAFVLRRLL